MSSENIASKRSGFHRGAHNNQNRKNGKAVARSRVTMKYEAALSASR
jgi:hypothetical protein